MLDCEHRYISACMMTELVVCSVCGASLPGIEVKFTGKFTGNKNRTITPNEKASGDEK